MSAMAVHGATRTKLTVAMGALESHSLWSTCLHSNPSSGTSLHSVNGDGNQGKIWAGGLGLARSHSVLLQNSRHTKLCQKNENEEVAVHRAEGVNGIDVELLWTRRISA